MQLLLYLLLWIGSIGLAIFSNQNIYLVTVKLASLESIKLPLGLVLIFCVGLGAFLVTFLVAFSKASLQSRVSSIPKTLNSSTKTAFQKTQTDTQKAISKNELIKKKQKISDDFDDERDENWD